MKRNKWFNFRVSPEEQQMIELFANLIQRTKSDAIRWIVMNALREMDTTFQPNSQSNVLEKNRNNGKSSIK